MSVFFIFSFLFCVGCSVGWLIELIFRRFISRNNAERLWINPGYLRGPWLPLYGFGLTVMFFTSELLPSYLGISRFSALLTVLLMAACMTALEYLAGIISTRLLGVRLWDYSKEWGNLDGLICPKFSLIWAILCLLYYYFLHPLVLSVTHFAKSSHILILGVVIYLAFFLADLASTLKNHQDRHSARR